MSFSTCATRSRSESALVPGNSGGDISTGDRGAPSVGPKNTDPRRTPSPIVLDILRLTLLICFFKFSVFFHTEDLRRHWETDIFLYSSSSVGVNASSASSAGDVGREVFALASADVDADEGGTGGNGDGVSSTLLFGLLDSSGN